MAQQISAARQWAFDRPSAVGDDGAPDRDGIFHVFADRLDARRNLWRRFIRAVMRCDDALDRPGISS